MIRSQLMPGRLRMADRASKSSSTFSEKTIYSPSMDTTSSEADSLVNQEIHEASVDVNVGQSLEEYRQSLVSMESSVSLVKEKFEEIGLIKELEHKINLFTDEGDRSSVLVKGFGKLVLHNDVKIIESSDYCTENPVYRKVFLFEKDLVVFKHIENMNYEASYPISELILNSIVPTRNAEQAYYPEPALFFIRQVTASRENPSPVRYINMYFKKIENAEAFATAFLSIQEKCTSSRTQVDKVEESYYQKTEHLDNLYYGILNGSETFNLLAGTPNGTFLVRFSTNQMRFAIALSYKSKVYNLLIEESPEGNVFLDEQFQYRSIKDLVNSYRIKKLEECFSHLPIRLETPFKDCEFYRVIHQYEPGTDFCLDIRPGDIIQLLDSTMKETGWLFGRMNVNGNNKDGLFPVTYAVRRN